MLKKKRFLAWAIAGCIAFLCWAAIPVAAQLPTLPSLPSPTLPSPQAEETVTSECIRVDGRCLFKVTAPKSQISERVKEIEQRLLEVSQTYFRQKDAELNVEVQTPDGQNEPEIYLQVGEENPVRLMTITSQDAALTGDELGERATEIAEMVQEQLQEARAERRPELLMQRGIIAAVTVIAMVLVLVVIYRLKRRFRRSKRELTPISSSSSQPVSTQLSQQQQWNLKEIQHRLLQLVEVAVWLGGILFILGLFPYTRPWRVVIFYVLRIPLRFAIALVVTYIVIRVSFVLIDRLTSVLTSNYLLTPEADRRLQLRVSTISGVTKGVVTAIWIIIGFLVALSWVNVDIGPLLAGAGILGLAVSFASQNLIKDALNGFFIILEDQYAIGDIISVGDVAGLVENINLRITQLRDAEGRLITIPNSEVKIVANLSSNWSRADITVPVNYRTDIDSAIALIKEVAEKMTKDTLWREQILEPAQVLGVDNFGDRGLGVRVWIKTQPLKQWDVSREFRRRIKVALDEAGITIPVPQQELWFNESLAQNFSRNGKSERNSHDSDALKQQKG